MSAPIKGADERELLPCPFCGGAADMDNIGAIFTAGCDFCGAEAGWHNTEANAVAGWNQRSSLGAAQEDCCGSFDPAERVESWKRGLQMEARGIERAAQWVDSRRAEFESEHGSIDPETGAMEFGRGAHAEVKREYAGELAEIAAGLRSLIRCDVPPAGWICTRVAEHDGPCAAISQQGDAS